MKHGVFLSLFILSSAMPAFAQQPTYCHTIDQCKANGGKVSKSGLQCLYNDGQVKSFVFLCDGKNPYRTHYGPTEEDPNAPEEGPYNGDHD